MECISPEFALIRISIVINICVIDRMPMIARSF